MGPISVASSEHFACFDPVLICSTTAGLIHNLFVTDLGIKPKNFKRALYLPIF